MHVELLVVPDCPHDATARGQLRAALDDVGPRRVEITTTVIDSQHLAGQRGFIGSPTILINGRDPSGEPGQAPGLSCRIYDSPDGRSGVPGLRCDRHSRAKQTGAKGRRP